jgi:hypothetical protein
MQLLDHDADDSHGFHRSEIKTICISQYQDLKKKWKNVIGYRWPVKDVLDSLNAKLIRGVSLHIYKYILVS